MRRRITVGAALLLLSSAIACQGHAAIIADFTDGNGATLVDQYAGIGGSGWVAGWTTGVSGSATSVPTVTSATQLNGGGNYVSVPYVLPAGTSTSRVSIRRQFEASGDVDPTLPYTVSFDFRPEAINTLSNDFLDRYQVFGSTSGSPTQANVTWWAIAAAGNSGGPGTIVGDHWGFLTNPTPGTTAAAADMVFIDSGLTLVPNTVYHFEFEVDPANLRYFAKISDGVTVFETDPLAPLYFRNQSVSATSASWMTLGASQRNSGVTGATPYPYSVDSLSISVVPEPGSLYLIGMASLGLVGFARRRRR